MPGQSHRPCSPSHTCLRHARRNGLPFPLDRCEPPAAAGPVNCSSSHTWTCPLDGQCDSQARLQAQFHRTARGTASQGTHRSPCCVCQGCRGWAARGETGEKCPGAASPQASPKDSLSGVKAPGLAGEAPPGESLTCLGSPAGIWRVRLTLEPHPGSAPGVRPPEDLGQGHILPALHGEGLWSMGTHPWPAPNAMVILFSFLNSFSLEDELGVYTCARV